MVKSYHHGDLHHAMVQQAIALIAEHGADALSLRQVAKRVGVSHAAPYRHFPSKEHLLAAIGEDGFIALKAALDAVAQDADWLGSAANVYVGFALEHPAHFQVMFSVPLSRTEHPDLGVAGRAALDALVAGITAAQARGVVRSGDPFSLALTAWSTVHGLSALLVGDALPPARFGLATDLVDRVIPELVTGLTRFFAPSGELHA